MASFRNWIVVSLLSAILWAICETLGGLAFLAGGVRLWSYQVAPIFWRMTSPVIWLILFVGMPPFIFAFRAWERRRGRRIGARCLYLMIVGSVMEVLINTGLFQGLLGRPLFLYEVLPTFGGSGSLLSPLYYLTLYPHYSLTEFLLRSESPLREVSWKPCS